MRVSDDSGGVQRVTSSKRKGGRHNDARRERWREHRQTRRAELVETAVRAIGEHGPEVGMEDIANAAGVTKPVLYRYFSDKSDLYLAVGVWGTDLLMERIAPALSETGSITHRIRRVVTSYLSTIEQYPELYRFVVRRTFADRPVESDPVTAEKTVIANALSRLLGEYLRQLGLDSGGVEPWSHGLVGLVQASGDWWLERQSMSREDLTDYLTRIIWFAIDGVLRSGGIVIDPNEPFDLDVVLRLVSKQDGPDGDLLDKDEQCPDRDTSRQ